MILSVLSLSGSIIIDRMDVAEARVQSDLGSCRFILKL